MTTSVRSFADFGVEESITRALADAGISVPFPIQELTLPLALSGADIIGQARTGTGKTLAFGIPLLSRVDPDLPVVQALVTVPTRELCLQVTGDLNQAGVQKGVDVAAIYGGRAIEPQVEAIRSGAGVVVGTPGRLLDLLRRGDLRLDRAATLVLDEADEMLDLGFLPDVEQLIEATAQDRQTLLFSATMPSQVVGLARRYMRKPTFLRADVEEVQIGPATTQHFFSCHRMDKPAVLARILQTPGRGLCVVFSRTKRMADFLSEKLRERGITAAAIHSDLRQETRDKTLARFRKGKGDVLVATEVAARGLDISDVTHVVNYDCPDDEKMYLHRIGRTGRAGAAGVAITLALWNEMARLEMIKRELGITDPTHEVFSTSPILDELFDLPPRTPRVPVVEVDDEDDEDDEAAVPHAEDAGPREDGPRRRRRRRGGRNRRPADRDGEIEAPVPGAEPPAAADAGDEVVGSGDDRPATRRTRQREDTRAQRRERTPGAGAPADRDTPTTADRDATTGGVRADDDRDAADAGRPADGRPADGRRSAGEPAAGDRDAGGPAAGGREAAGARGTGDDRGAGDRRSRSRSRTRAGVDRGRDAAQDDRGQAAEAPAAAPDRPAADRPAAAADHPAADGPAAGGDRGGAGAEDPRADAGEQGRGRRRRSPLLRSPLGLFSGWGGARGRRDPAPEEAPRPEPDPAPDIEPVPDPAPAPVAEADPAPVAPAPEDGGNGRTRIRRRTRGGEAERPAERTQRPAEEAVRAAEPRPTRPAARRSGSGVGRRDRDRSARTGRPARPAGPARAVVAPPDPEAARGAGRPTRSRPMAIDHLP